MQTSCVVPLGVGESPAYPEMKGGRKRKGEREREGERGEGRRKKGWTEIEKKDKGRSE